jgi:hypothetical protein
MRSIVLAAVLALMGSAAHAVPTAVDFATVSMTTLGEPRTVSDTLCVSDGRDLVCDRGAYLLPGGLISTTNISATRISGDGSLLTNLPSAAASPTNVPAFSVHKNGTAQTVVANTLTKLTWGTEDFDTYNNFSGDRFTPTVPGKYLITLTVGCNNTPNYCLAMIFKNGVSVARAQNTQTSGAYDEAVTVTKIIDMNGTTDYVEAYGFTTSTVIWGTSEMTNFSGSLLASGNGLISGSTALGDRITSGTASGVVAMAGGTVSFTTGGTSGTAYLDTVGRFVGAGVSTTGAISATSIYAGASLQLSSPTAVTPCTSTAAGTIRYNSPTTTLELCTGSGWQPMGVGIPAGTISAFASTTCPTGWSEYTAARGRFLRGIDNGAGNDPDGTRAPGATQADALQDHYHSLETGLNAAASSGNDGLARSSSGVSNGGFATARLSENVTRGFGNLGSVNVNTIRWSTETRPKNVAVTYCQFNGTSNGWNNPLSGGSTTAAGSTGQLQYNTGNSFDASAGLTWTNASSLLTVTGRISATNISVTALTVNGVDITSGGGASRLASLTDVTTSGAVSGSVLAFNAATSSWTALPIQQVMSTTTMISGWPDAIRCNANPNTHAITFLLVYNYYSGTVYYRYAQAAGVATEYGIAFNATDGSYQSANSNLPGYDVNCANRSIAQLYAEGKAFNFIGSANASGGTALGDRITSGTSAVVVNSATGIVSITQLGADASYVHPSLGYVGPGVSATGTVSGSKVATNVVKFSGATGTCATAEDEGTFFYDNARKRLLVCSLRN